MGMLLVPLMVQQSAFATSREECVSYAKSDGVPDEEMPAYIEACMGESATQYYEEENYTDENSSQERYEDSNNYDEPEYQYEDEMESNDQSDTEWEEEDSTESMD